MTSPVTMMVATAALLALPLVSGAALVPTFEEDWEDGAAGWEIVEGGVQCGGAAGCDLVLTGPYGTARTVDPVIGAFEGPVIGGPFFAITTSVRLSPDGGWAYLSSSQFVSSTTCGINSGSRNLSVWSNGPEGATGHVTAPIAGGVWYRLELRQEPALASCTLQSASGATIAQASAAILDQPSAVRSLNLLAGPTPIRFGDVRIELAPDL